MPATGIDPDDLARCLRHAVWIDEHDRLAPRFDVVARAHLADLADGDQLVLLVVTPAGGLGDTRYLLAARLSTTRALADAATSMEFTRAVVDAVRAGREIPALGGGRVVFGDGPHPGGDHGDPTPVRPLPFDPGWSSNALSLVDIGGTAHIHKTYRRLSDSATEPAVLRLMSDSALTGAHVGDYHYEDTAGTTWPLGVVYEYVAGQSLDAPLRDNLRSLWPLTATEEPSTVVRSHLAPLAPALRDVGRFLREFHTELRARTIADRAQPVAFPIHGYADQVRQRFDLLAPSIDKDEQLPTTVRRQALDAIRAALHDCTDGLAEATPHLAGLAHGDLHLAHLIDTAQGHPGSRWRVIDLSVPALEPAQAGYAAQTPWQDLVSLQRALEYFTGTEFVFECAQRLGESEPDTCVAALYAVAGVDLTTLGWAGDRSTVLRRVGGVADLWRSDILSYILDGYTDERTALVTHAVWRLLYLGRLLHELEYNYAHGRTYFAAIDLRYAIALAHAQPPTAANTTE